MNERLKELAEQAGLQNTLGFFWQSGDTSLERFAELVRQDERGACARACEIQADDGGNLDVQQQCANAIRARGESCRGLI